MKNITGNGVKLSLKGSYIALPNPAGAGVFCCDLKGIWREHGRSTSNSAGPNARPHTLPHGEKLMVRFLDLVTPAFCGQSSYYHLALTAKVFRGGTSETVSFTRTSWAI